MGNPDSIRKTDDVIKEIVETLEGHGILDYVLVARDPDRPQDHSQISGSTFWVRGVGDHLSRWGRVDPVEILEEDG